ncbi:16S rRNA (cytosine(1402)-N(4))-methyltransferase RsmH [Alicyclobacillus kakegawensis]|uniref:16S rRNA (cytosine(1402)-N(4))-methyltransferase RsmH n=1 Tax=Alicyclobacillus kakegawensis TaxID=392012 RepID=UPI000829A1CC|nr:16S rRNA (cytosine(1402)-N(4))-methyltransferase RsmH [Alicyclobacillus kakegawensis]
MATEPFHHVTVLLQETVDLLRPQPGGTFIDCTLGGGGHSRCLLARTAPDGRLLALDQDRAALAHAQTWAAGVAPGRMTTVHSNFRHVAEVARRHGFDAVDGILFDLGVSSPQFDDPDRGFSYRHDAELDMRMDVDAGGPTAADLVNQADAAELARIFFAYGEERFARRIAQAIVRTRQSAPIRSTGQLAEIVKEAIPAAARRSGPHPARRVFQALRVAVNDELGALRDALEQSLGLLTSGGRVAVISFHSLEDRIVKRTFASWAEGCVCPPDFPVCRCGRTAKARVLTRKPVQPGEREKEQNPRSRSAKLRVAEKV